MKTLAKIFAAGMILGGVLSAGEINLVGVGAGVSVLGLEVGAVAGVNIGYHSPVIREDGHYKASSNVKNSNCDALSYKQKCYSQNYGAPLTYLEEANSGERVVEVTEYYCLSCPVCLSCK